MPYEFTAECEFARDEKQFFSLAPKRSLASLAGRSRLTNTTEPHALGAQAAHDGLACVILAWQKTFLLGRHIQFVAHLAICHQNYF